MFIYTAQFNFFVHEACGFNTADDNTVDIINDVGRCPGCQGELSEATEVAGKIEMWRAA